MPDLMQFKRGPLSNIKNAKLVLGEPAFLYDKKVFCIGMGEANEPVYFINEKEIKRIISALNDSLQESIYTNVSNISSLDIVVKDLDTQVKAINNTALEKYQLVETQMAELDRKLSDEIASNFNYVKEELNRRIVTGKIKSSDLSTAYDADKIGLTNLKQEVINYINNNGGGSVGGGGAAVEPASIGFSLLSVEVVSAIQNHDFGTFSAPLESIGDYSAPAATFASIDIPASIGFDMLSPEVVESINNSNFGYY